MSISILLPFKENYSPNNAGAVSLFVNDTFKKSIFKKKFFIFGCTNQKKILSKNYINIFVKKNIFRSSNYEYVKNFLNNEYFQNTELLEVHNRPIYIKQIRDKYQNSIVLYFHNDPLLMLGSKTINDREYLLNNVDKLVFNSSWCLKRFFIGFNNLNKYLNKVSICYQSTDKTYIDFKSKKNIISFIGKLNSAKGYDIFAKTVIKILNKFDNWNAYVFGDEPREKLIFKHKNLHILGFKSNKYILNFLKKTSISVISSRWNEPFGRTSLEAASRGSAVIISKKGGLPETSSSAIIVNPMNVNNLYKKISSLILNKKKILKIQKKNYKDFFLTHEYVTNILDEIRKSYLIKKPFIKLDKSLRVLHITNFNHRFDGRLQFNTGRRINNGLIRLGHNVMNLSDRDIIHQSRTIFDLDSKKILNKRIINSYNNFKPNLIILGHADNITYETLDFFKKKKISIAEWFLDPVSKNAPDYLINKKRVLQKNELIDAVFLTSDPSSLEFDLKNSFYIPNPCDKSFEILKNYNHNCNKDLFFAMSHGVHRGTLKKGKFDNRELFLNKLIKLNKNIIFDLYGMNGKNPVWGYDFIDNISDCSMGLNLSRGKPYKYYSSDRISQLIGNGLLTFIDERTKLDDFFSTKQVVFYKDINDLSYKLNKFKRDYKNRREIAKRGKEFYFKYFNSNIIADFIIKMTLQNKISKKKYLWHR